VALRPEPFGALAYHYDNRRLNFLRSSDLVKLVDRLGRYPDPRSAFDDLGLRADQWPRYSNALDSLAASDFLQPVSSADEARLKGASR
jgi:putative mycofactocin binding protein MftB